MRLSATPELGAAHLWREQVGPSVRLEFTAEGQRRKLVYAPAQRIQVSSKTSVQISTAADVSRLYAFGNAPDMISIQGSFFGAICTRDERQTQNIFGLAVLYRLYLKLRASNATQAGRLVFAENVFDGVILDMTYMYDSGSLVGSWSMQFLALRTTPSTAT